MTEAESTCSFTSVEVEKTPPPVLPAERDIILKYIRVNQTDDIRGFTALDISQSTNISINNVRSRLSELYNDGVLTKPFRGYYQIPPSVGCRLEDTVLESTTCVRLQNLVLCAVACIGVDYVAPVIVLDEFSLRVRFTVSSGLISARVKCDRGLDPVSFRAILYILDSVCCDEGYEGLEWMVSTCEGFSDWYGVRLDGYNCVSVNDLYGNLVKLYEKPYGVRGEGRWSEGKAPVDAFFSLMRGDIRGYNLRSEVERNSQELSGVKTALISQNGFLFDLKRSVDAIMRVVEESL